MVRADCMFWMGYRSVFFQIVWCWGWDGAGDLDGPDVDPIWERTPNRTTVSDAVKVRHRRDLKSP